MGLQELRAFYFTAKLQSFTKAADALVTSQPTISRQIRALERDLGSLLMHHGARPLRLTPAGDALIALSEPFLQGLGNLDAPEVAFQRETSIAIVGTVVHASRFLPRPIAIFRRKYPKTRIQIMTRSRVEALALIQDGFADFGVLADPELPSQFEFVPLYAMPMALIAPLNHPVLDSSPPRIDRVVDYPLIMQRRGAYSRTILGSVFRKLSLTCEPVIEVEGVRLLKLLVSNGLGLSILPCEQLTSEESKQLAMVPLDDLFPPVRSGIVTLKGKDLSSAAAALLDLVQFPGD